MDRVCVSAFEVPTSSPEADGTLSWNETVLVTVEITRSGVAGFGYTYADVATARFVSAHLASIALGHGPMDVGGTFEAMERAVRNLGRDGVAAMAIAAVDMACWDLKAKLLRTSLVGLLGPCRREVTGYGSGGFTSYTPDQLRAQLRSWKDAGFRAVKMKIANAPDTVARVCAAREAIGDEVDLFVDANGAYRPTTALRAAERMAAYRVTWFEEPVSSDDLDGLRLVRARAPAGMAIAAGEYGYRTRTFERMLEHGCVDVLQADATRCGVTGFMAVAALCDGRGVPLSAHCGPTVHAHLGCASPSVVHVECFHDHMRIEKALFEGAPAITDGVLRPDPSRHGLGVELNPGEAERYRVYSSEVCGGTAA